MVDEYPYISKFQIGNKTIPVSCIKYVQINGKEIPFNKINYITVGSVTYKIRRIPKYLIDESTINEKIEISNKVYLIT